MGRTDDENGGDSSSSIESSSRRRRDRKMRTKSSSKSNSSGRKHHKKTSDRKKKKKKSWQYRDDESHSSASEDDDSHYNKERKRRKKERKRETKHHHKKEKRKRRRRRRRSDDVSSSESTSSQKETARASSTTPLDDRNVVLADALMSLLEEHPALVEDLPIMLIRLAGGTSFDLSQMTNVSASRGIAAVFACLEPFGVHQDATNNGAWMWKKPPNSFSSSTTTTTTTTHPTSELVLIRLVRAMLDQVGLTVEAIHDFEQPRSSSVEQQQQQEMGKQVAAAAAAAAEASRQHHNSIQKQVKVLLNQFQQGETSLAKELAGLCNMILEGESVALDGLPDERLRGTLESLFVDCGLEKSEMEEEEGDDNEEGEENDDEVSKNSSPIFGYGIPEGRSGDDVRSHLMTVLETCKAVSIGGGGGGGSSKQRAVKGPMPMPASYTAPADYAESDSDDEGPLLPGADKRGPSQSKEMVQARAARRSLELESVRQGLGAPVAAAGAQGKVREEWMLVPGKFDLLSAVKSGQSMKSRNFQARSKAGGGTGESNKPVDPVIQAEISAIRQAHEQSRGPSLLQQHRQKKETEAKAASNKKEAWKWDRDRDLDAGRKVDKNALKMLFGSAGTDLKSKFHS